MKTRLLTFIMSIFWTMGVFAQEENPNMWSPVYSSETTSSTTLYAIFDNEKMEKPLAGDKVAAFVDNECRDVYQFKGQPSTTINGITLPYEIAVLRVRGNDIDAGKEIVIKLSLGGGIYTIKPRTHQQEMTFQKGESTIGMPSNPVCFTIPYRIRSVMLMPKDPTHKEITMRVGDQINLDEKLEIKVSPGVATLPENAFWNSKSSNYYNIQGNILTALNPTGDFTEKITLTYGYPDPDVPNSTPFETVFEPLIILPKVVPVDKIELVNSSKSQVNRDEPFDLDFRIYPANATNQQVEISSDDPEAFIFSEISSIQNPKGDLIYRVSVTPKKKGIYVITIRTVDGGKVVQVETEVRVPIVSARFAKDHDVWYIGQRYNLPDIILEPADADLPPFYEMKTSVITTDMTMPSDCKQWKRCDELMDDNGWYFIPRVISKDMVLELYLGGEKTLIQHLDFVKNQELFEGGWHWVSVPYAYDYKDNIFAEKLVEIRSEMEMVYNDPKYGWFGDNFNMLPTQCYKINSHPTAKLQVGFAASEQTYETQELLTGWNWIGVPYEYDYDMTWIPKIIASQEGDVILSKNDGMMTYTQGTWQSSLQSPFILRSGEGYMYKATQNAQINWGVQFDHPQPQNSNVQTLAATASTRPSYWQIDNSRFSSAMAVIGQMTVDNRFNSERYSIGAFVNDECRGEGRILDNGLILLSLNGKVGEEIKFKLLDKETEEILDFETLVHFEQIAGSVQHPVPFTLKYEVTGIEQISGEDLNIHFEGEKLIVDGGYSFKVVGADGKLVSPDNLAAGVYVVVVETPNGPLSHKIVKK